MGFWSRMPRILSEGSRCSSASQERGTASTISRGGRRSCPPMRNMPWRGEALTRSAGRWTTSSPTAPPPASPSWEAATTRQIGSQTFCKRCRKEQNTTTGCSATTTTTEPLMKSTSCCGSRSCESSEAGQSREKHGDTAVPFSALSVDQARRAGKEESP